MKTRIRRNDTVQVLRGRDRGKRGKVLRVFPAKGNILVEGVNFKKKSMRRTQQNQQGGIIDIERSLPLAAVSIVCTRCDKPVRLGAKDIPERGKLRMCRKCGEVVEVKL